MRIAQRTGLEGNKRKLKRLSIWTNCKRKVHLDNGKPHKQRLLATLSRCLGKKIINNNKLIFFIYLDDQKIYVFTLQDCLDTRTNIKCPKIHAL